MNFIQLLIASTLTSVGANLLIKKGVISINGVFSNQSKLLADLIKAAFNPYIIVGLMLYGLSFLLWLRVLSFNDISKAYPIFAAAVFLLITLSSAILLKENISLLRVMGISILLLGIIVVASS